jgi:hypothetical protein
MITQFKGESRKLAIVNHFSLDVAEEDRFLKYITDMGYTIDADDETIESLHVMWEEKLNN